MLPCQSDCPSFHDGCHKSCAYWREFQARQTVQRQAKKSYLHYYNELCFCMTKQLRTISTPSRYFR